MNLNKSLLAFWHKVHGRIVAAVAALLVVALVVVVTAGGNGQTPSESDGEKSTLPKKPVPVQVAKVEQTTLRPSIDLVGTIMAVPERTAVISAQLGGWVNEVKVVAGQPVRAGTELVTLDARLAGVDVARTQAVVAEKQAILARLKRGFLPHELEAARQRRDKSKADMESLNGELAALKPLLARNELSAVQYDTKAKALEGARATLSEAEAHLQLLEAGTPHEQIDEAQALLKVATADLRRAELAKDWCAIRSPINGVVTQVAARQGQFFNQAVPLVTVMDLSEVLVHLRIPSAHFAKVSIGTKVDLTVRGAPAGTLQGTVTRISGEADPLTGNVDVYASVKNGHLLRPGLSCRARVWLPDIPDATVVPVIAVADHSGTSVVTVIRDQKAYEVKVELGTETADSVQILKGLSAGDVVATVGGYGLPDGCPVEIAAEPVRANEHKATSTP
jgi:HlyD family secretion protein